jgi:hypothetical protein
MALRWYWAFGIGMILLGGFEAARAAVAPPQLEILAPIKGGVRIRNRSASPVRLVILRRQSTQTPKKQPIPIHWDFAPREGRLKGLLLALPSETIALDRGDILTAFAQDGSARYWGPYIVGESPQPIWNDKTTEWEVTLEE